MEKATKIDHLVVMTAVAITVVFFTAYAPAADIYVNSTDDEHNGNCIFECTLRDAILVSNANGEYDRIYVPAGHYNLTIPNAGSHSGETGDLLIDSPEWVEIIGEGPGVTVVDGNGIDRVFRINPGSGNVQLRGMTIQGGDAPGSGGGVFNVDSTLLIHDCHIVHNHALSAGFDGGGVFNGSGNLHLVDCLVAYNSCEGDGGGVYLGTGSFGLITKSTIYSNEAVRGGAAFTSGTSQFVNATVFGNSADDNVAGLSNIGSATLYHSTFVQGAGPDDISISSTALMSEVILVNSVIFGVCDVYERTVDAQQGNIEFGDTCHMGYGNYANAGVAGIGMDGFGYYGGGVPTVKLLNSSWAIDNQWTTTFLQDRDARFVTRPQGTYGDSGAFELVPGEIFIHGFENGYTAGWGDDLL